LTALNDDNIDHPGQLAMIASRPVGLRQTRFAPVSDRRFALAERLESSEQSSAARQVTGICIGVFLVVVVVLSRFGG